MRPNRSGAPPVVTATSHSNPGRVDGSAQTGAAGAGVAPLAGAFADRRGPRTVIQIGAALVVGSFTAMAVWPGSLALLIAATVAFDLGVQACLIAHQTIVYSLDPAARSRLNAVLVSSMFLGMSVGAALASIAPALWPFSTCVTSPSSIWAIVPAN